MFDKYLNVTDASKVSPEHVELAYTHLKKYCDERNLDVVEFVSNPDNIPGAAEYIQKELPFAVRLIVSQKKVQHLIETNIDFIKSKAIEFESNKHSKKIKT